MNHIIVLYEWYGDVGIDGMFIWYCNVHGKTFSTRGALQRDRNSLIIGVSNHSSVEPWC
jgi:hypothetical protein